ncbi:MAG: pyrG, partial [Candidatus Berkelbacteria bacterium]|nr:pyrG [Candidatus Berkelbacteria bacterium]
ADVLITEIGGTIGDYEGTHFVEAIRQMQHDVGKDNVLYVHVGFLPYLGASEELKARPIQFSVHDLQTMGIQPDILICRSDHPVAKKMLEKIALFTGIDREAVIPLETVDSIYKVPMILKKFKLHEIVSEKLKIKVKKGNGKDWQAFIKKINDKPTKTIKIALVGKYMGMKDTYFSVTEALKVAAIYNKIKIQIDWVDAEEIEKQSSEKILQGFSGIIVPGGFGSRGIEGKIAAIKYAREHRIPFMGLCYGLQLATIEFARHVCKMDKANTTEIDPQTPYPIVYIMPEQEKLLEGKNYGATMRLGAYPCKLVENTKAAIAYNKKVISERHRHRYEINNKYLDELKAKGLIISGTSPNGKLVEIIELPSTSLGTGQNHPFFVATQFHPELKSRPLDPHPLFIEFIKAAIKSFR